jgi:cytidine deaminase
MEWKVAEIDEEHIDALVQAARSGVEQAFLTKPGDTRYGAAVLTASGKTFNAGQYSSFNHITNVHAEMAAIIIATMAGEPDVVALALVCTGFPDKPARPCGVCRQFLYEHCVRTGWDILVVMAGFAGKAVECDSVSTLLPKSWIASSLVKIPDNALAPPND